ncbi:MAG: NUDIX hydrolase [Anaerolineae bacterium]
MKPETVVKRRRVYQGKLLNLDVNEVALADGTLVKREIVSTRGAVVIIPLTGDNRVRLVRQFRAAVDRWVYELPAGGLEPDEDPGLAAPRELAEETGDTAATWQKLGGFYPAPGILTEYLHLYLATNLTPGPANLEFDEHIEVITLSWAEAMAKIKAGEIEDAKTIAGLALAALHLPHLSIGAD